MSATVKNSRTGRPADKEFRPRQQRPEEIKMHADIEVHTKALNSLQEELKKIQEEISNKSVGKEDYIREKEKIADEIQEVQKEYTALEDKRKNLLEAATNKANESKKLRFQVAESRRKLSYGTEAEVDDKIAEIQNRIETTTMPLKTEKELILKLSELKAIKPKIRAVQEMAKAASQQETHLDTQTIKFEVDQIKKKLDGLRDKRKSLYEKRDKLSTERSSATSTVRELYEKRDAIRREIGEHQTKRNDIRNELSRNIEKWRQEEQHKKAIQLAQRAQEARKRENDRIRNELVQQLEAEGEPAFVEDLYELQNFINFLKDLQNSNIANIEKKSESSNTELQSLANVNLPKDVKGGVLLPKHLRNQEEDGVTNKKKGNKKEKEDKFKLDITAISLFGKYKQTVPTKPEECQNIIDNIQSLYDAKQKEQKHRLENAQERRSVIVNKIASHDARVAADLAEQESLNIQ